MATVVELKKNLKLEEKRVQVLAWAPPSFLAKYFHACCYYPLCFMLLSFSPFCLHLFSSSHAFLFFFFFSLCCFFFSHVIVLLFVCCFLFCTWCCSPLHTCCFLFCVCILLFFTRTIGLFFTWLFFFLHIVALLFAFLPCLVIFRKSLYYPPTIPSCRLGVIKSWEPNELFF